MGKPDDATLAVLALHKRLNRPLHRTLHAVVLMPLGDDLEAGAAIGPAIGDEALEEIQQRPGFQQSPHQHFQLELAFADLLSFEQSPTRMPQQVGAQRAVARHRAVGDDIQKVEPEQLRDIGLVSLYLVPG